MITFNLENPSVIFPISFPKNIKFSKALDKLMEFHSDIVKNKNIYCKYNEKNIDFNLTIEQNGILNHANIQIVENTMD